MIDYTELVKALRGLVNGRWRNIEYDWFAGEEKVFMDAAAAIEALIGTVGDLQAIRERLEEENDALRLEPKRGEWIIHPEVKNIYGGVYIECPFCGEKYVVQNVSDEKFCRNCGADMSKKMEVQE